MANLFNQDDISDNKFEKIKFSENVLGKKFFDCEFVRCDFTEITLEKCQFTDCNFIECNLSLIKVTLSAFINVAFDQCKMVGVNWTAAKWPQFKLESPISFYHCNISESSFYELGLSHLVLESCKAHHVDFRSADVSHASLAYTDFMGSYFGETNLSSADLVGSENYSINVLENEIKGAKFSLPDAVDLLGPLGIKIIQPE